MKKAYIFIPVALILLIQIFDEKNDYFSVQIFILICAFIYAVFYIVNRKKSNN